MKEELVAAGNEMARHGAAHDPQTNESEIHLLAPTSRGMRLSRPAGMPFRLVGSEPAQARRRRGRRFVFAADRAAITEFIDTAEEKRVVDLAGPGLVATGIVGELDMADAGKLSLDGVGDIALHYLRMIDIVLEADVARARRRDDVERRTGAVHEETWNVSGVNRLK